MKILIIIDAFQFGKLEKLDNFLLNTSAKSILSNECYSAKSRDLSESDMPFLGSGTIAARQK